MLCKGRPRSLGWRTGYGSSFNKFSKVMLKTDCITAWLPMIVNPTYLSNMKKTRVQMEDSRNRRIKGTVC